MKTINLHEIENYHLAKSVLNYNLQMNKSIQGYLPCIVIVYITKQSIYMRRE